MCSQKIYTALHTNTKGEMHVLKKDGLEKAVKKVVSEKETLSCMFRNEHRCAVYFYSNQKISHPLSSFADVQRMLSFFDVPGSHSHVLLSKHKNDEWQDLDIRLQ